MMRLAAVSAAAQPHQATVAQTDNAFLRPPHTSCNDWNIYRFILLALTLLLALPGSGELPGVVRDHHMCTVLTPIGKWTTAVSRMQLSAGCEAGCRLRKVPDREVACESDLEATIHIWSCGSHLHFFMLSSAGMYLLCYISPGIFQKMSEVLVSVRKS